MKKQKTNKNWQKANTSWSWFVWGFWKKKGWTRDVSFYVIHLLHQFEKCKTTCAVCVGGVSLHHHLRGNHAVHTCHRSQSPVSLHTHTPPLISSQNKHNRQKVWREPTVTELKCPCLQWGSMLMGTSPRHTHAPPGDFTTSTPTTEVGRPGLHFKAE